MSTFGPAFFISRRDNKALEKKEQANLLKLVIESVKRHGITDDQGQPASPSMYDYDGYEKNAVSFLIYSSMTWSMMPEEAQQDQLDADIFELKKVEADVNARFPDVYSFKCYYVEN